MNNYKLNKYNNFKENIQLRNYQKFEKISNRIEKKKLEQENKGEDFWKNETIVEEEKKDIQIYKDNVKFFFTGFFITIIIILILIIFRNEDLISDGYQKIFCSN